MLAVCSLLFMEDFLDKRFPVLASFWTAEEVDLSHDLADWNKLNVCCDFS